MVRRQVLRLGVLAGLAVSSGWLWFTLSAAWVGNRPAKLSAMLAGVALAVGVAGALAFTCGLIAARTAQKPPVTEDSVAAIVTQDQLLYLSFSIFAIALPAISFVQSGQDLRDALAQPANFLAAPFFLFYAFTIKNNRDHFARQGDRIRRLQAQTGRPRDSAAWLRTLELHMSLRFVITVCLAALTIIPLILIVLGSLGDVRELFSKAPPP